MVREKVSANALESPVEFRVTEPRGLWSQKWTVDCLNFDADDPVVLYEFLRQAWRDHDFCTREACFVLFEQGRKGGVVPERVPTLRRILREEVERKDGESPLEVLDVLRTALVAQAQQILGKRTEEMVYRESYLWTLCAARVADFAQETRLHASALLEYGQYEVRYAQFLRNMRRRNVLLSDLRLEDEQHTEYHLREQLSNPYYDLQFLIFQRNMRREHSLPPHPRYRPAPIPQQKSQLSKGHEISTLSPWSTSTALPSSTLADSMRTLLPGVFDRMEPIR